MIHMGSKTDGGRYLTFYDDRNEIIVLDFDLELGGLYLWCFFRRVDGYDLDERLRVKVVGVDVV